MTYLSAIVILLVAAILPVTPARAASSNSDDVSASAGSSAAVLERLTDVGSAVRLGFGVSPLGSPFGPVVGTTPGAHGGESRDLDPDSRGAAVSFDLTLAWPGTARTGAVEPYVALGPALFVIEADPAGRLLGTRIDPTLQVGAKAGAGVNWRVGKRTTLFGAYEVMAAPPGGFVPSGPRTSADHGVTGYDFTYGLRFVY
jgi:hypothetical protein